MTDRFRNRLSEYLDGGLDEAQSALMSRHLEECSDCAATLAELERVRDRAGKLAPRVPERDLWAGIEARMERPAHAEVSGGTVSQSTASEPTDLVRPAENRLRRVALTIPQIAAAAIVIAGVSAAGAWSVGNLPDSAINLGDGPVAADAASLASTGPQSNVPGLADQYGAVIEQLEQALFESNDLTPEGEASLRRALLKIDRAIEDAVQALEAIPGDPYLEDRVQRSLERKADFLRNAVRLSQS